LSIVHGLRSNVYKALSNLWFLHVMNQMLFKLLDINSSMFHILLDWWYGCGCFPRFEDELLVFNIYDITSMFLREPTPKNFTSLINMNSSIYSFSNRVLRSPYCLSNMHLICVSTCRHNNRQQHIFEGQVLRVSNSGYLNISRVHGI
jgi:hypothetical protein